MDRRALIHTLCGDNADTNFPNCFGGLNSKCIQDGYCDLNHLSNNQVDYILSSIQSDIYLNACSGSGKTEVVGIKCAYEMLRWDKHNTGIAILTFTNSAEKELFERVAAYYRKQLVYPHFIGTFTSWLHGYIANPFLYVETGHGKNDSNNSNVQIIDAECTSDFLNSFKTKYSYGKTLRNITANEYIFNAKRNRYQYCGGLQRSGMQEFQRIMDSVVYMKEDIKNTKHRFWKAGLFLYEDIEILTYKLLVDYPILASLISKRFPLIIVDECQDLSYTQLLILEQLHLHGTKLHFVGDLDQSIYTFRDIDPSDTREFLNRHGFTEIVLNENYRSNQDIVDATGILINRNKYVTGMCTRIISMPLIVLLYKKDREQLMVNKYIELLNSNGFNMRNCRIIVRNNSLRAKLKGDKNLGENETQNTIEDYAHAVYLLNSFKTTDFQIRVQLLSRAIQKTFFGDCVHDNKIKLYRPKEISESSWWKLISDVQKALFNNQEIINLQQTWDKWKNHLKKQLTDIDSPLIIKREAKNLRLRKNVKDIIVNDTFYNTATSIDDDSIKIETIHSCKGMSLESVLLVSSYRKGSSGDSGNYWREWFPKFADNMVSESNRLAYVAASRAKHMLVLGIPNPSTSPISSEDIEYLKSCGFQIINC